MKIKFLKLTNWLLVSLMGILGFSSCHSHKPIADPTPDPEAPAPKVRPREEIRVMYGVPTMNFRIHGQVRDSQGHPVPNIRVNMLERGMHLENGELQGDPQQVANWLENSAAVTDADGRFSIENSGRPQEEVRLMVRDVDGADHGNLQNRVVNLPVTAQDIDQTAADGWNQGTFNKNVEIELESK